MNPDFIPIPTRTMESTVRRALTWIMVALLAAAVFTAFVSVLEVIEIWFEYQYVPIARGLLAVLIAALALYVMRVLLRKPEA